MRIIYTQTCIWFLATLLSTITYSLHTHSLHCITWIQYKFIDVCDKRHHDTVTVLLDELQYIHRKWWQVPSPICSAVITLVMQILFNRTPPKDICLTRLDWLICHTSKDWPGICYMWDNLIRTHTQEICTHVYDVNQSQLLSKLITWQSHLGFPEMSDYIIAHQSSVHKSVMLYQQLQQSWETPKVVDDI